MNRQPKTLTQYGKAIIDSVGRIGKTSELKEEPFLFWMMNGNGEVAYTDDNGRIWYKKDKKG